MSSPPRSPSPAPVLRNAVADALHSELQEVRALRDKLQAQLVKRREDNEALQQQLLGILRFNIREIVFEQISDSGRSHEEDRGSYGVRDKIGRRKAARLGSARAANQS